MLNRLFVASLLLTALFLAVTLSPIVAADNVPFQDFDRNACYDKCPCNAGIQDHACAVCKQRCDMEFWRQRNEQSKKKGN